MTIVTKPLTGEKKPQDQMAEPLVADEKPVDVEKGKEAGKLDGGLNERYHYILRTRVARVSSANTLCLLITALLVMTVGLFGGLYIYKQMSGRSRYQSQKYRGYCNVPYWDSRVAPSNINNDMSGSPIFTIPLNKDPNAAQKLIGSDDHDEVGMKFFREDIELDLDNEKYSKVEVPDFKNGRMGRFIHEFDSNKTAIVDQTAKRCFIMPLDRERVLPPKSMFDMIQKMWQGYYAVNTGRVRETMRVVLPPLEDLSDLGDYIQQECQDKTTYSLEKSTNRIVKRSASKGFNMAPYVEFTGTSTMEYDIVNLDQLDKVEKMK